MASLWTANLGLLVSAAVHDCPVLQQLMKIAISQNPFGSVDDGRRLADSADPATRRSWLRMVTAKRRVWEAAKDNRTAEAFKIFLRQQHADLRALCARDVLELFSDAGVVAELIELMAVNCGKTPAKFNQRCVRRITHAFSRFTRVGRFGAQMEVRCPEIDKVFGPRDLGPQPKVTFGCGDRLEGVAWSLASIGRDVGEAADSCRGRAIPALNYGYCATEAASAAAYVAAAALSLTSASQLDCQALTALDLQRAGKVLDGDAGRQRARYLAREKRLECARDLISATRQLGLAAAKASSAAGHCGGKRSQCGQDASFTATALAATAEAAVLALRDCKAIPNASASVQRDQRSRCTQSVTAELKELSVSAALAMAASESCRNSTAAAGACGGGVSKIMAAFSYLLERTATAARNCPGGPGRRYSCGLNLENDGQAASVASLAVASAAINCGLGTAKRLTKPVKMVRRFWVPR